MIIEICGYKLDTDKTYIDSDGDVVCFGVNEDGEYSVYEIGDGDRTEYTDFNIEEWYVSRLREVVISKDFITKPPQIEPDDYAQQAQILSSMSMGYSRGYSEVIDTLPEGYAIRKIGEATEEGDEIWVCDAWIPWVFAPKEVTDGTIRYKVSNPDRVMQLEAWIAEIVYGLYQRSRLD